ncbi:hypothetical protein Pmani_014011 [Petrolisthes manimaculis]|uniref:Uncharacterized protein n=1 Tax=Petrolisthes manimaculis TaxID=1843537 RepID=A0AAE1PUT3_9EUCA|nr:hypothetical protein Pmani_014011 [Petrolisthes manimaculis]
MINTLLILSLVSCSLAVSSLGVGVPSASYGTPLASASNINTKWGYSYDGDLLGSASTLLGGFQVDPITALTNNIPGGGVPGEDVPDPRLYTRHGFNCQDQEFTGYFADTADEAGCQVVHICAV